MMNQNHVLNQIPDYVLGLLPRQERLAVEQHTAVCPTCRQQLHQESEIGPMVRATLTMAAQPSGLRLRQIMPAPPVRQRWLSPPGWFSLNNWQHQLAVLVALITLIWGSLNFYRQQFSGHSVPDGVAVTATITNEPTMTVASVDGESKEEVLGTAVPTLIIEPTSTPAPAPTPIAAVDSNQLSVNSNQYPLSSN